MLNNLLFLSKISCDSIPDDEDSDEDAFLFAHDYFSSGTGVFKILRFWISWLNELNIPCVDFVKNIIFIFKGYISDFAIWL